jgi:prolyl-tRNA editing enzyme YbaK/EbsC (Cys-tRNA(Pro) deacylase)
VRTSVDVHNFLTEREAPHEVFRAAGRFRSPDSIAAVLDLPPEEVGWVAVFEAGDADGAPVAAVIPSHREPDPKLLARAVGRSPLERATERRATELTEYLQEAVPPAGLPDGFEVVLDRSLDADRVLYFPGGEPMAVLKIRGVDLARATGARVAKISRRR